jgi:trypsin
VKIYDVVEKFQHPNYDRKTNKNDIAILKLNETVNFTELVFPICLPNKQYEINATATGFGRTSGVDAPSETLLKVGLHHFPYRKCLDLFGRRTEKVFRDIMICYGDEVSKKDACRVRSHEV